MEVNDDTNQQVPPNKNRAMAGLSGHFVLVCCLWLCSCTHIVQWLVAFVYSIECTYQPTFPCATDMEIVNNCMHFVVLKHVSMVKFRSV